MAGYVIFPLETLRDLMTMAQLRASYTIVDHRERQIAPHSLAFNLTAQRFAIGVGSGDRDLTLYKDYIVVSKMLSKSSMYPNQEKARGFIQRLQRKVKTVSKVCCSSTVFMLSLNLRLGIISSLAFSPVYGSDGSFFAAATFTSSQSNIALFSDAQDEPLMFLGGGPRAGVTQVSLF